MSEHRSNFECYAQMMTEAYKTCRILQNNYNVNEGFSATQLQQWNLLTSLASSRTCFVAGSLHPGEETFILDTFQRICQEKVNSSPLLILVKRHFFGCIQEEILTQCNQRDLSISLLSEMSSTPDKQVDIIDVDTFGLLKEIYSLATAAIVGGTFLADRHHNYCEPQVWGTPVYTGLQQHDREVVLSRLKNESPEQVKLVDPEETSELTEDWIRFVHAPVSEEERRQRQANFLRVAAQVEPELRRSFDWLSEEQRFWLKELAKNESYDSCPYVEEFQELELLSWDHKVNPWVLELLRYYEDPEFLMLRDSPPVTSYMEHIPGKE